MTKYDSEYGYKVANVYSWEHDATADHAIRLNYDIVEWCTLPVKESYNYEDGRKEGYSNGYTEGWDNAVAKVLSIIERIEDDGE